MYSSEIPVLKFLTNPFFSELIQLCNPQAIILYITPSCATHMGTGGIPPSTLFEDTAANANLEDSCSTAKRRNGTSLFETLNLGSTTSTAFACLWAALFVEEEGCVLPPFCVCVLSRSLTLSLCH